MKKVCKFFLKLVGILALVFGVLFAIFFFDLDGKLLFNFVEPFIKKHYDNMERADMTKMPYDISKYPAHD